MAQGGTGLHRVAQGGTGRRRVTQGRHREARVTQGGVGWRSLYLPSHVGPLYSVPQLHSNPPLISVQEPPFLQGLG